jgi:hypothetical protein
MSDVLEQRDRATDAFKRHHDVKGRRSGAGDRRYWRLEQLADKDDISPEQCEAGQRWRKNFQSAGFEGSSRSCLDMSPRGVSGNPNEFREDAARAHFCALVALDGSRSSDAWFLPSAVVTGLCVEDLPISRIAFNLGLTPGRTKVLIGDYLTLLAEHYAAEDKRRGKSSTAQTKEAALARFEPEVVPRRSA